MVAKPSSTKATTSTISKHRRSSPPMRLMTRSWVKRVGACIASYAASPPQPVEERKIEERLQKEMSFDPDVWIVEIEDKAGRHFLELAKA